MDQGISTKPISSLGIRREFSPSSIPMAKGNGQLLVFL